MKAYTRSLRRLILLFTVSILILPNIIQPPATQAGISLSPDDPIPSPILDPDSVGWASSRNMTDAEFTTHFEDKSNAGYMVIDIEAAQINGEYRVGAVWQKNIDGRLWSEWRDLTASDFDNTNASLRAKNYRMIDQETYVVDGRRYFAGVWIFNSENLESDSYRDKTDFEFTQLYNRHRDDGDLMIDIDAYVTANGLRYAAVWVKNSEGLGWVEWRDMTSEEFSDKFDQYKDEYRMIDVESYQFEGTQYYAGIWVENVNGRGWAEYRDMTSREYSNRWYRLRDAGYRLISYEAYETDDGWRYAGIWRQNSDRPDWYLKDTIDDYLQGQSNAYDIPGMSVAIIQGGKFVYLRGLGYADYNDDIWAQSRTVYRLASVSKAVAGVLSMQLVEAEGFDLTQPTAAYVPSLSAFHTHTISQTITNRSGIGHYDTYGSLSGHYDTAFGAVQDLEDEPLAGTPGAQYIYSTHAYTFLGAAMEAESEQPIADIVDDYLRVPYNLTSLRAEDENIPNKFRATLYDDAIPFFETSRDDMSWKVLGGGLEASAYDMARLGIKLVNGDIITDPSLDLMWTQPDSLRSYGYGWDLGTQQGVEVVGKSGSNNGSKSYWRIYPSLDVVIVVLTNRDGDHSPRAIARSIGLYILNTAPLSVTQAQTSMGDLANPEDLDEPDEEEVGADYIDWPVETPQTTPSPEDLEERDDAPVTNEFIYMPIITTDS